MTRVLLTLVLLTGISASAQDPVRGGPGRLFVRLKEEVPTQRTLAANIRARLKDRTLLDFAPSTRLTARDAVIVLDRDTQGLAPARVITADSRAKAEGTQHVSLAVRNVDRVLRRVFPDARTGLAIGTTAPPGGIRWTVRGGLSSRDRADVAARKYDLLVVTDEPATLASAEVLTQLGADADVPTVTTAPWLAQSSACVGVIPDLEAAAANVLRLVRDPAVRRARTPSVTTFHLGAWRDAGHLPSAVRLAWAHRIFGAAGAR